MASFIIEGGHKLRGEITPQGAKNEALQVISAILLTSEPVTIHNIPNILDVNNLISLLSKMGVRITELGNHSWTFQADQLDMEYLGSQEFVQRCSTLRGSILTLGPLLARFHKACVAKPGGDQIGRRRLDTHFIGIQELGAKFNYNAERGVYEIDANGNAIENTAKHFDTDNGVIAFKKAAEFYRHAKCPQVNIFDNELGKYVAEWD